MYGKGLALACVPFYPCGDRFVPRGYREDPHTLEQKLAVIAGLGDVAGVELSYPAEFEDPVPIAAITSLGVCSRRSRVSLAWRQK